MGRGSEWPTLRETFLSFRITLTFIVTPPPPSRRREMVALDKQQLQSKLWGTGQEHLLEAYDTLSADEKDQLAAHITSIDFVHLNRVLTTSLKLLHEGTNATVISTPPVAVQFDLETMRAQDPARVAALEALGMALISHGHAAVVLLAGGSGTRLGVTVPKGFFSCDKLRQRKSLFQFHCERIRRIEQMCASTAAHPGNTSAGRVQVLIMTSAQNDEETQTFFAANNYFGLTAAQVHFFQQSSLPCYDEKTGKVLMASSSSLCLAPGGNGGLYQGLARVPAGASESLLSKMKRFGVRYVQTFNVDNILAPMADPCVYGQMIAHGSHVCVKSAPKASPNERVGVFALINSEWGVVEYTEIGCARAAARDTTTGELLFNCAHISLNACSMEFLERAAEEMATCTLYHAARKQIPTVHGSVMGVKLEAFIFDMFRYCTSCPETPGVLEERLPFCIIQVDRTAEFAPIKNADVGEACDSPSSAASILLALHTKWALKQLEHATRNVPSDVTSGELDAAIAKLRSGERQVEISPLLTCRGEGLEAWTAVIVKEVLYGSQSIVLLDGNEVKM